MNSANESKSKAAQELSAALDAREDARIQAERRELTNLNQGMESSGHDVTHPGINWAPTFKKRRKANAKKGAKDQK